jgi:hypothetical protein
MVTVRSNPRHHGSDSVESAEEEEEEEVCGGMEVGEVEEEVERRKEAMVKSFLEMIRGSFFLMSMSKTIVETVVGLLEMEVE